MRRSLVLLVLALSTAGLLAATASAKEMSVSLGGGGGPPSGLGPGETWNAQIIVETDEHMRQIMAESNGVPAIAIWSKTTGEEHVVRATHLKGDNWRARVVFPTEGEWVYELSDGFSERAWELGYVTIGQPTAAPSEPVTPRSQPEGAGLPLLPFLGGGALLAIAGIAAFLFRRFRLQPRRFGEAA